VNELLIPAFEKIEMLGGHRSKGGGKVQVKLDIASEVAKTTTVR
jgi:hypothetical protein